MTFARSLKATVAIACLLPMPVFAQSGGTAAPAATPAATAATPPAPTPPPAPPPVATAFPLSQGTNWVTLGGQYDSSGASYLGRYTGVNHPGFYGIGDFHLGGRDAWDSGGTRYWDATGRDLGLDSRSASVNVGQQGTWGLGFSYDGIPYFATNSFQSIYQPNGQLVPGIPAGSLGIRYNQLLPRNGIVNSLWIPGATNSPANRLFNYNLGTQRDVFTGTGKFIWGEWTITGSFRHDHKEGFQSNSLAIGGTPSVTTAGTGAASPTTFTSGLAYFAMPIDYDMDRYDVMAAYTADALQVQVGYTYSQFTDNASSFAATNPFAFFSPTLGASFGGSVANISGNYSQAPSNSAHQIKVMVGYNFNPTTRLNANFAYGLQMQNQAFPLGIGNTNIASPTLPRASFDGLVQTTYANVALTAQPIPKLDLRFAYTMDDRNNQSPRNLYTVYPVGASNTFFSYYNLPFSFQHQIASAEASYRILPQTKVILNDTFDSTYRTYANTSLVTANTISAKVRSELFDDVFGSLSYGHQDRVAHHYQTNGWWPLANVAGGIAEPANFVMFFEASRKHDEVKGTLDVSPVESVNASLVVKYSNDTYPDGTYGLRSNHNLFISPDVSWRITPTLNAHAFYSFQQIYYNQTNLYTSSTTAAVNTSATGTGFNVPWNAKTTDQVHTFGAAMDWQAIPDVLKFGLDYNFAYGNTAYAFGEGVVAFGGAITSPTFAPSITMQPLPDVKSMLSVISLHGEYSFRPNMTLLVGYAWERFTYKDFMVGSGSTQFANAFLPGTLVPNDSIHVVSAALRFRF
jgi:MtrB/PioB family decaheme-associated outer membrane protein